MKFRDYIIKRLLLAIPTILILLTVIFFIMRVMPGDPVETLVGEKLSAEALEWVREAMGLNKPLHIQYIEMIKSIFTGDLGTTIWYRLSVSYLVFRALPATIEIILLGFPLGITLGLLLGIISVFHRNKIVDHIIRIFSFGLYSMPGFWLAMLFQLIFAVRYGWFPVGGRIGSFVTIERFTGMYTIDALLSGNIRGFFNALNHLSLPTLTMALMMVPMTSRITRASVIETLSDQYITTARAKGLLDTNIILKHALRNALLPIITTAGVSLIGLIGSSISVEFLFAWPGLGSLLVTAALERDAPLLEGCILVYSVIVIFLSTVMDILYSVVDPRIKLGG